MAIKVSNGKDTFEVDESNLEKAKADGFVPTIRVTNGQEEHDVHPSNLEAAQKDGYKPIETSMAKRLAKGFTEALPVAGGLIGGTVGTALGPAGTIGGAGLGAAGGKALENIIEKYGFDEDKSRKQIYQEPIVEGLAGASGEMAGPIVGKVAQKGIDVLKDTASSLSKIPRKAIDVYAERAPEISKITAQGEMGLMEEADKIRQESQKAIDQFKNIQNSRISKAVETAKDKSVDIGPMIEALESNMIKLDPKIDADKISKIQKELDLIVEISDGTTIPAQQAYSMQKRLQELADYIPPGQAFKKKDFVDLTFKKGAAAIRSELGKVAPEISQANAEISKLRQLDKTMNKNLITPEKPYASLMGAGTGENQQSVGQIQKLQGIIGQDMLPKVENLAAAKYFNNAGILPAEKTGSSLAPLALGAIGGVGSGLNNLMQGDLEGFVKKSAGGLALGSLASPLAIKGAILASRGVQQMAPLGAKQMINQFIMRATQMGVSPQIQDKEIGNQKDLPPTERAKARNHIRGG